MLLGVGVRIIAPLPLGGDAATLGAGAGAGGGGAADGGRSGWRNVDAMNLAARRSPPMGLRDRSSTEMIRGVSDRSLKYSTI